MANAYGVPPYRLTSPLDVQSNGLFRRLGTQGVLMNGGEEMAKNYEEVAMDVIREDWEFRKSQHNASFNQERIARMMGISRSQFAKALRGNKNPTI